MSRLLIPVTFPFSAAMHKRRSFEHEKEVRALIINKEKEMVIDTELLYEGLSVLIDFNTLIESISPINSI